MRKLATVVAATVAVSFVGASQAANTYSEPAGGSATTPPPAGTQEFVFDSFAFGNPYTWENSAYGRTIALADPGPSTTFVTDNYNQIRPNLRSNASGGGDVDLFKISVADPNTFQLWTGRTGTSPNTTLLTLFKTDGTAVAASLGAVQVGATGVVAYSAPLSAAPGNPADPGIINGASLGIPAGDYIVAVSTYISASGKAQPKNDAGQNLFNLVPGTVVTPNALGDIKLSTDPLKGWDLYTVDGGTVGSFDMNVDQLLGKTSFNSGLSAYINVFIPEPGTMSLALAAGALVLRRRNRA
jgi:hypothetical protein